MVAGSWRGIAPLCYCIYNNRSKNNNNKKEQIMGQAAQLARAGAAVH